MLRAAGWATPRIWQSGLGDTLASVERRKVEGNADLNVETVRLVFRDYLPQTGDRIRILTIGDTLQVSPSVQFDIEGVLPGFAFDIDQSVAGEFAIVALTDARTEEVFANGFE